MGLSQKMSTSRRSADYLICVAPGSNATAYDSAQICHIFQTGLDITDRRRSLTLTANVCYFVELACDMLSKCVVGDDSANSQFCSKFIRMQLHLCADSVWTSRRQKVIWVRGSDQRNIGAAFKEWQLQARERLQFSPQVFGRQRPRCTVSESLDMCGPLSVTLCMRVGDLAGSSMAHRRMCGQDVVRRLEVQVCLVEQGKQSSDSLGSPSPVESANRFHVEFHVFTEQGFELS